MELNIDVKFEGKLTMVLKMTGIWQILTRAHKSLKIRTFIGPLIQSREGMNLKFIRDMH